MGKKKKILTSAVALGTALALTLGGTFAWQSISQKAVNEASDIVNPGGRLHNDQHWVSDLKNDTNIYVENFTDPNNGGQDIYARVRLSEYMEVVMNYGVEDVETVATIAGSKTPVEGSTYTADDATRKNEFTYEYDIHYFGDENATDDFFTWAKGDEKSETVYFMPTFNKNKDSLLADLNGEYVDTLGGISNRGDKQYTYTEVKSGDTAEGWEVYDGDSNTLDEVTRAQLIELIKSGAAADCYNDVKANIALVDATGEKAHTATTVGTTKGFLSLTEWLEMVTDNGYAENGVLTEAGREAMYGYWVYDEDGWVYWTAPIEAGETTGLLLDGIELNEVMDDTWYYAIDVEAQFVTPDDVGKDTGTGFYTTADSGVSTVTDTEDETETPLVSENAEKLLALIGVQFPEEAEDGNTGDKEETLPDFSGKVTMRNITSNEYDLLCTAANEDNDLMHWNEMYSWTDTISNSTRAVRGFSSPQYSNYVYEAYRGDDVGLRPAFEALPATDCTDLSVGDVAVMGTLYVGNEAIKVPTNPISTFYKGSDMPAYDEDGTGVTDKITLGKALENTDYQMKAVYVGNGVFVCDRVMLNYISWKQLSAALTPDEPAETPEEDTTVDESTAEEIVRTDTDNAEEGLKVTYKRQANAVYMAGSGSCEFKLKPEYNSTVVTDTDKLTLTVTVDGTDKATVTSSDFTASTDDGDGWLKCTVSDLFTDKTGDVEVALTVTYTDGDTTLTTAPYEITFTQGGSVVD